MVGLCQVGPISVDEAELVEDDNSNRDEEKIQIFCSELQARQLLGMLTPVEKVKYGRKTRSSQTGGGYGIVPIDGSSLLDDNINFTHRGLYLITGGSLVKVPVDDAVVGLDLHHLGPVDSILDMDYTTGIGDLTHLPTDYEDTDPDYSFQEDCSSFDDVLKWYPYVSKNAVDASITSDGSEWIFSSKAATDGVYGELWTQGRNFAQAAPFFIKFDMTWVAQPTAGNNSHSMNFVLCGNRSSSTTNWNNSVIIALEVSTSGVYYHAYLIWEDGRWEQIIPLTSIDTDVKTLHWKFEVTNRHYIRISLNLVDDDDAGYMQVYYGPTRLTTWNVYYGFWFNNKDSTAASMKMNYFNIYDNVDKAPVNIVPLPAGCTPFDTPTFNREGEDGIIPCFLNPTGRLQFMTTVSNWFKGCVKGYNANNPTSAYNLITGTDEVLDPTKFYVDNSLIQLVTSATGVGMKYYDGTDFQTLDEFTIGTINALYPVFVNQEIFRFMANQTEWTMWRGKPFVMVKHPNTDLDMALKTCYAHDGTSTSDPIADADITMETVKYATIWDHASGEACDGVNADRYRLLVIKQNHTTIKSDSIPASIYTGLGVIDSQAASPYNQAASMAYEFASQVNQSIHFNPE